MGPLPGTQNSAWLRSENYGPFIVQSVVQQISAAHNSERIGASFENFAVFRFARRQTFARKIIRISNCPDAREKPPVAVDRGRGSCRY
jgi:hypothetical protein